MKFNSKEEFIAEAERRGLKEGVAFSCSYISSSEMTPGWTWNNLNMNAFLGYTIDYDGAIHYLYETDVNKWATPLETPLEDRVKALEEKWKQIKDVNWNNPHRYEPTQSSRHFIMEGIIEKIYPKDKEKALEALVNVARIDREVFDYPKRRSDYQDELAWSSNTFYWEDTEQGRYYWEEISNLLK